MNEQKYQYQADQQQSTTQSSDKPQFWKYVVTVLVTVLITFTLTAGSGVLLMFAMGSYRPALVDQTGDGLALRFADDEDSRQALAKLQSIFQAVKDDYYDDLSDAELIEAMARGLVNELDNPYTMYMTAEQVQRIDESMSGQYSGIGAYVGLNPEGIVEITDIIESSPAESAGIMVGDLFFEVDGEDVSGYADVNAVAALVRGIEGTTVDLVLYRPSQAEYVELTVTRRLITTENVVHRMITPVIGYIQIRDFSSNSGAHFIAAMQDLQSQGALEVIFDLRNNTGGLAHEVIQMLDYLLPEAVIATLQGRKDGQEFSENWVSREEVGVPAEMHYAILVNQMSASASELFAGCLRDYDKAVLIGRRTLGKGSGTITIRLDDGSAINLTNFLYYLPGGESIEGTGIPPDQEVILPDEALGLPINRIPSELDHQLQAAIDYLNNYDR